MAADGTVRIRADFGETVVVTPADHDWIGSPQPGVERMMLERVGDEVAVATSFVRFAPNARFPHHVHERGEEFLVLEGDFHDADADYPAGTYARHPCDTEHEPWSDDGCLLFVKLRQFDPGDTAFFAPEADHFAPPQCCHRKPESLSHRPALVDRYSRLI